MAIIFCLNSIPQREENLKKIVPTILNQADKFYVNLVNYDHTPKVLTGNPKFVVNHLKNAGSEIRFLYYNDIGPEDYYFTIDDDIRYPHNYASVLIKNVEKYNHKALCSVHGTILDLKQDRNFYGSTRSGYNYKRPLAENAQVMLPGCGTLCISKRSGFKINMDDFKVKNMSDAYIGAWAHKQGIPVYAIARKKRWLKMLPQKGNSIWGNNPYKEVDKIINECFK